MELPWWAWLLIALGVAGILGVVAYLIWGHQGDHPLKPAVGIRSFTLVLARDLQNSNTEATGGDVVQLQYLANGSGNVRWDYQVGSTWNSIIPSTKENPVRWKIPGNIFGPMRFRVSSVNNLAVSAISKALSVSPTVTWTTGLGTTLFGVATVGTAVAFNYEETGEWIARGSPKVYIAGADTLYKTFNEVDGANVSLDVKSKAVNWTPVVGNQGSNKIRIATTTLKAQGYPVELTYDYPHPFIVSQDGTFGQNGTLANIKITGTAGKNRSLTPGSTATLTFDGTLVAHDWYYSTDDGNTWSSIEKNTSDATTAWTIPINLNGSVVVRAVTNGTPAGTTSGALYGESSINVGSYLVLVGNGSPATKTIDYMGSTEGIISTVKCYVFGYNTLSELEDKTRWRVGWYVNTTETDEINRLYPYSATVTNVSAISTGNSTEQVAFIELTWLDSGYDAPKKDGVPLAVIASFQVGGLSKSQQQPLSVVSHTLYRLKP